MTQRQLIEPGRAERKSSRRRERDAYYTPDWATATLIERAPEVRGGQLLDPCCGDGRMARAVMDTGRFGGVVLNDIAQPADLATWPPAFADCVPSRIDGVGQDACDPDLYDPAPCWVVTNPPWNGSGRIAWTALQHARVGVALLLRITWLEPCEGREWLKRLPPTRMIVLPRISYDGSGQTDSATSAWFIWTRGTDGEWQRGPIEVAGAEVGQGQLFGATP